MSRTRNRVGQGALIVSMLSLREAARRFAVSRATLAKALEKGVVSGARDVAGHWRIDAAELSRVYQPRAQAGEPVDRANAGQVNRDDPAQKSPLSHLDQDVMVRLARAEAELAAERDKTAILERHLDDLRRLLPGPDSKPRRRWWPF